METYDYRRQLKKDAKATAKLLSGKKFVAMANMPNNKNFNKKNFTESLRYASMLSHVDVAIQNTGLDSEFVVMFSKHTFASISMPDYKNPINRKAVSARMEVYVRTFSDYPIFKTSRNIGNELGVFTSEIPVWKIHATSFVAPVKTSRDMNVMMTRVRDFLVHVDAVVTASDKMDKFLDIVKDELKH